MVTNYELSYRQSLLILLSDPGKARGCSTNIVVVKSPTHAFPPPTLRRRHTLMDRDSYSNLAEFWFLTDGGFVSGRVCKQPAKQASLFVNGKKNLIKIVVCLINEASQVN